MTTQSKSLRIADKVSKERYSWPGGYPLYAVTNDGAAFCHGCCDIERKWIGTTTGSDGWCVIGMDINWESSELYCNHCGDRIEAAFEYLDY
jgi:hypothetical protein